MVAELRADKVLGTTSCTARSSRVDKEVARLEDRHGGQLTSSRGTR